MQQISSEGGQTGTQTGGTVQRVASVEPVEPNSPSTDSLDLLQIYPSKTNNLEIQNYEYLSSLEPLLCKVCPIQLLSAIEFLRIVFGIMSILLLIDSLILIIDFSANPSYYVFLDMQYIAIIVALMIYKIYLLFQSHQYITYSRTNSLHYHTFGMRLYYGLCGDVLLSFLSSFYWLVLLLDVCLDEYSTKYCDRYTSFEYVLFSILTWFISIPLFIYSIFGMFL